VTAVLPPTARARSAGSRGEPREGVASGAPSSAVSAARPVSRSRHASGRPAARGVYLDYGPSASACRYAAGVAPETAGQWLVHAERTVAALDSELWPESVLRDETLGVLGIDDVEELRDGVQPLDHAAALAQAITWLGEREPGERAPRV
jgi:hypothetical protein